MRGRFYIHDEVEKFTANLINLNRAIEVSSSDFGIHFALGDEHSIHPVPTNHSAGRGLCRGVV
jgi:hypothetical protein